MSGKDDGIEVSRGDQASATRAIKTFIARDPRILGHADIYNLDLGEPIARAGMLAAVLSGLADSERRPLVRRFVIVVPPGTSKEDALEAAWTQYAKSFEVLAGRPLSPDQARMFKTRLSVEMTVNRRHSSVADIVRVQAERTTVIVTEAAAYRDDAIEPYVASGASTPLQAEDVWAPQLHALASVVTKIAGENALYVALDADELSPRRQALYDLLLTVDGCGVMGSSSDEAPETILASRVDLWDTWIREGRLGQALRDVVALPPSFDSQKTTCEFSCSTVLDILSKRWRPFESN